MLMMGCTLFPRPSGERRTPSWGRRCRKCAYTWRMRHPSCSLTILLLAGICTTAHAQPTPTTATSGEAVFRRICAACHLGLAQTGGATAGLPNGLGAHAVPREFL